MYATHAAHRASPVRVRTAWLAVAGLLVVAVARPSEPDAATASPPAARPSEVPRTIQSIDFSGNRRLSSAQLMQVVGLKVGDVSDKNAIGDALDRIVAAYRAQGSDLSVMVDIGLPDATHTAVRFLIDEQGTGGNRGAVPRGGRMGIPRTPSPATRQ